jgi:DNA-binding NarL/FixJ family response regulator
LVRVCEVIVVAADRLRSTLCDALGTQIQGYLLKPYQPRALIEKVKSIMDAARN